MQKINVNGGSARRDGAAGPGTRGRRPGGMRVAAKGQGGGRKGDAGGRRTWVGIALGVALAGVLIAVGLAGQRLAGQGGRPVSSGPEERAVKGPEGAPVVITMYSDFQCPYCAQADQTLKRLEAEYLPAGNIRLVYKHFAFIGDESRWAAEAVECAGDQGRWWSFHDKVFASQRGENQGAFSIANLKRFARDLGLDGEKFGSCLDSHRYEAKVRADTEEGKGLGVKSTPTFFINGRMVLGAIPYEEFKSIVEEELGASGRT